MRARKNTGETEPNKGGEVWRGSNQRSGIHRRAGLYGRENTGETEPNKGGTVWGSGRRRYRR